MAAGNYSVGRNPYQGFIQGAGDSITTIDPPDSLNTFVYAINNSGSVAGDYGVAATGHTRGFIRAALGNITTFDPSGSIETQVLGLNDSGEAAGFYFHDLRDSGFIRDAAGGITVIDPPGSIETQVYAINDSGQVAGSYADGAGVTHGFIATAVPVPEPATVALLGVGLAGLAVTADRKRLGGGVRRSGSDRVRLGLAFCTYG